MISLMNLPTNEETIKALHEFAMGLAGGNEIDVNTLNIYPLDSLGKNLFEHYLRNPSIPRPNDSNGFPARYILVHDLHHLLIGSNVEDQGEAEVMAFECGLLAQNKSELCLLPFISQLLESSSYQDNLNFVKIAQMFDVGLRVTGNLFESWQFEMDLSSSIEIIRKKYNLCQ
jgi:ubiquinone biosynthesis protein Coq4